MSARPVTGSTRFVGVIGDPVAHSVSPRLHNRAYAELGVDLCYGAFRVPAGGARAALAGGRALGFVGLSVTTPHKLEVARYADQRTDEVEVLESANTVVYYGGIATAFTTDGPGLVADLEQNASFEVAGASCAVVGAGGAARAVIVALASAGAREIAVVNRTPDRARAAIALAPGVAIAGGKEEIGGASLVVNATSISLGTHGASAGAVASFLASVTEPLREGQLAVDLAYHPPRSAFLEMALAQGAAIRNGLGMLVHQAALQVELFTGEDAPVEAMWDEVASLSNGS